MYRTREKPSWKRLTIDEHGAVSWTSGETLSFGGATPPRTRSPSPPRPHNSMDTRSSSTPPQAPAEHKHWKRTFNEPGGVKSWKSGESMSAGTTASPGTSPDTRISPMTLPVEDKLWKLTVADYRVYDSLESWTLPKSQSTIPAPSITWPHSPSPRHSSPVESRLPTSHTSINMSTSSSPMTRLANQPATHMAGNQYSRSSSPKQLTVDIHPLLTPAYALQLDFSFPSAFFRNNSQLSSADEPACFPPLPRLDLKISAGLHSSKFKVTKGYPGPITVSDLLSNVHARLRQCLVGPEQASLPYMHRRIATVNGYSPSLGHDTQKHGENIAAEAKSGGRVVDLLLGQTLFAGFTLQPDNCWQLQLETPLRYLLRDAETPIRYRNVVNKLLVSEHPESTPQVETQAIHNDSFPYHEDIKFQDSVPPAQQEGVPSTYHESRNSDEVISTFVIYSPVVGATPSLPKWTRKDLREHQTLNPDADITFSKHTPEDALFWVEDHYDNPLLETIRAYGLHGPMAAMLSPDESVLVLFGSILDDMVHQFAKKLSELSNFYVMIRPMEDDPVQKWNSKIEETSGTNDSPSGMSTQLSQGGHSPNEDTDDLYDTQDSTESDSEPEPDPNIHGVDTGVFRLRGGADKDSDFEPWYSPNHRFTIYLETLSDVKCQVPIRCTAKFTVQHADNHDKPFCPRTICKVNFRVDPTNKDVWPDRSHSKIVFVDTKPIYSCIPLPCEAHIPPKQTVKTVNTITRSGTAALGFNPVSHAGGMLGLSGTYGITQATESLNDRPTPPWIVDYQNGRYGQFQGRHFWEYGVAYTATDRRQHQMQIEFSVAMDPEEMPDDDDTTSFVMQHQTMLWMRHEALRSQGYGMTIMSLSHISNVRTETRISLRKESTITLAGTALKSPTGTSKNQNSLMEVSTKHALAFEKPGFLQRLGLKSENPEAQMETSPSFLIRQVPLNDINALGYTPMTKKWIMAGFAPWQDVLKAFIEPANNTPALEIKDNSKGKQRARAEDTLEREGVPTKSVTKKV
ncbi:hypothetical protein DFH06DRAFT_572222 [Mycena polygramma]|nr:hypothetical protein DFH06DRAFT_572222 [Mycena polygramma]